MRASLRFAVSAAALLLGACLISDQPLLDDANAVATPLEVGSYQSCQRDDEDGEPECTPLDATLVGALYRFEAVDEEEPTLARFRAIGSGAFLAQMWGASDKDFFYFYADQKEGALRLIMIQCADLPKTLRDRLVRRGDLEVEEGGETCIAKTLKGAEAAAKAYRGPKGVSPQSVMVLTKAAPQ